MPANLHPVSISIEPFTYPENESSFGLKCGKEGQGEAEEEDFEEITANSFGPANEGKGFEFKLDGYSFLQKIVSRAFRVFLHSQQSRKLLEPGTSVEYNMFGNYE